MEASRGMDLDPAAVTSALGGECRSALDLFVAIVRLLAGRAELYGEKTPNHLLWWRPLSRALPHLRVVAIVRDPRGVVASYASMPFGMDVHAALAEAWVRDQRHVLAARRDLGAERCLVLRYEDVVAEPDLARDRLKELLGRASTPDGAEPAAPRPVEADRLFMPWETWKASAAGPIVRTRVDAWRDELLPKEAARIAWICRREMRTFGYEPDPRGAWIRNALSATTHPADQWRRWHLRMGRARRLREIEAVEL